MSAKSEGQIFGRERGKLTLLTFSVFIVQVGKSERFEYIGIRIEVLIVVQTMSGCSNRRSFRYKSSI